MLADKFTEWVGLNFETKNTIRAVNTYTNHFFSFYPEFNQENVNAYLTKRLEEGVKPNTFNTIVYVLKNYAKFLKVQIEFPKVKKVNKKIKDYITLQELEGNVLPIVDMIFEDYQTYDLLARFMFFTGLRVKEIMELKVDNIDFAKESILVVDTKGKVDRKIPFLDEKLFKDLNQYIKFNKRDKVFDLTYRQITYGIKKLGNYSQPNKKFHPHFFRTSFAKYCVSLNIHQSIIQSLLGHKDSNTTFIYCEPDSKMVMEACQLVKRKG